MRAWQASCPLPDELFTICSLGTGGSSPTIGVFGQYLGDETQLRAAVGPLTRVAAPSARVGSS